MRPWPDRPRMQWPICVLDVMVQPIPKVLRSHGLKKPEEYTRQELGKLMVNVHKECGVTILVNVPYADRHHKYPTIMPKVVRFTMTSGAGTCTSTRTSTRSKCPGYSFYNNFWPGYLLHSEFLKDIKIYLLLLEIRSATSTRARSCCKNCTPGISDGYLYGYLYKYPSQKSL
jgi:hypothetical protein